jgi:thiol:disulfide interchange protein
MTPFKTLTWPRLFAGFAALALSGAAVAGLVPKKDGQPEFLPVDQAFEIQPLELRDGKLVASWRIAKDYYLYRDRLKFTLAAPAAAKLGAAALPTGEKHHDEHFGTVEVYRGDLHAELPITGAKTGPYKVTVVYQGCADAGLCYPPQTRTLELAR